jgi:hypothetical protein
MLVLLRDSKCHVCVDHPKGEAAQLCGLSPRQQNAQDFQHTGYHVGLSRYSKLATALAAGDEVLR